MSPTQRSLKYLRDQGWFVAIVEKWNAHLKIRQDLWGFGDLIAVRGNETMLIQTTSGSNVTARIDKIINSPAAYWWLRSDSRSICVHGWRKTGAHGKRKTWNCRAEYVTADMITEQEKKGVAA